MPELNFNVLARQGPSGVLQGFQQGQDIRLKQEAEQQAQQLRQVQLQSSQEQLANIQQDRQELAQLKEQLRSWGQDPDPHKFMDVLIASGIPEYVEKGYQGKQKLRELDQYEKLMGGGAQSAIAPSNALTASAAPSVPAAAPATNALTAPAAVPAAQINPVAAQFGPEQVAAVTNRIQGLLQLGTPQALQAARVLQDQLEMLSKQKPATQYMAVGNNIFNAETGQFVKNPYATTPAAAGGSGAATTAASANDEALIARAIRDGRLDLSQVTSKNKSVIASTLKANPDHDFRTSGVEFMGAKAGSRTLGTSEAKMVQAASEATEMMNITRQLIPTINPTDYPLLNQAGNYVARNSGNPAQVGFATALNGLVNTYARAINPTGVPTVSDKQHAREVINSAMSSGQLNEALRVMQLEMDAALASPAKARKALGHTKETEVPSGRKPAQAAPAVSADEKAQALSWAKANRSDPRAAKILQMYGEK